MAMVKGTGLHLDQAAAGPRKADAVGNAINGATIEHKRPVGSTFTTPEVLWWDSKHCVHARMAALGKMRVWRSLSAGPCTHVHKG